MTRRIGQLKAIAIRTENKPIMHCLDSALVTTAAFVAG